MSVINLILERLIMELFNESTGIAVLLVYGIFAFIMTYWYSKGYDDTKESFLVARRELNTFQGSLSVAAAWLWAPGLFISAQQAVSYTHLTLPTSDLV